MRLELWIILITFAVLFHMYTDGKYVKNIMVYKKQMKMAGVVFSAFVLYGCQEQLNAWFEVDHVIRLEYGGSNHVDNLVALCRECHGKKTTIENL